MITHSHRLDMVPGGVPVVVNVSQYDDDFAIAFALYARTGTLTYPAGTTAEIRGTKTDGHAYSATAAVSNGVVTVSGHKQMTAIAGKQVFEVVLMYDSKELSSANFILNVERAPMDLDTIPSESVIRELYDCLERVNEILQAASDSEAYGAGTRDGTPVTSGDSAYHNNAPYYLGQIAEEKTAAIADVDAAGDAKIAEIQEIGSFVYVGSDGNLYYNEEVS